MVNILVVEDDKNLQKLIATVLQQNGYAVICVRNGSQALSVLETSSIDLIISDIMMPEMDGYEFTTALRQANFTQPLLIITAKDTLDDKRRGFHLGADDYMVKPIDIDEMVLRVEALLRRSRIIKEKHLVIGEVTLDYNTLTVTRGEESVTLPKKEFYLLFKLLSYPRQIFTRQQLMDDIWGIDAETDERTVDVHIKRLRDKFANYPEFEIVTVRGLGYKAEKKV